MDHPSPNFLLRHLLGILTPEEIDELVVMNLEEEKVSLTQVLMNKLNGIDESYEKGHLVTPEKVVKKRVQNSSKNTLQRPKFPEALDAYKKSSLMEVKQEKKLKDKKQNSALGVLVDKKES